MVKRDACFLLCVMCYVPLYLSYIAMRFLFLVYYSF